MSLASPFLRSAMSALNISQGQTPFEFSQIEAPTGSRVKVEGTWAAVYAAYPSNPFAVLGGLGN